LIDDILTCGASTGGAASLGRTNQLHAVRWALDLRQLLTGLPGHDDSSWCWRGVGTGVSRLLISGITRKLHPFVYMLIRDSFGTDMGT